jgi:alkanesulfonate monooxygenase SsuD/methylene tetrahydromethanopterin reductase-like flavin-dependent oxidoreductase (luciferase family)
VATDDRLRRALTLPPFDALASPRTIGELGRTAEAAGWDGLFVWDHVFYREPVRAAADPWACLAAVALATQTIALGPMVTPLPRRRPQIVARQAVSLDHLCEGRLILGLGLGSDGAQGELSRFGEEMDARTRGAMLTEGLRVLDRLFSGEPVRHRGEHYLVDDVTFLPRPYRESGIPIWLASRWPNRAPVRRAARYDGLFTIDLTTPQDVATLRDWVAAEQGHDEPAARDGGRFEIVVHAAPGDDPAPWAAAGATWHLTEFSAFDLDLAAVRAVVEAGPGG